LISTILLQAESLRQKRCNRALAPLFDVLAAHRAAVKCQLDAFAAAAAEERASKIIRSTTGRKRRSRVRQKGKNVSAATLSDSVAWLSGRFLLSDAIRLRSFSPLR